MDKNLGELQSRVGLAILAFVFDITRWPSLVSLKPHILKLQQSFNTSMYTRLGFGPDFH